MGRNNTCISNFGFFNTIDPGNYLCDQFETTLQTEILKSNSIKINKIPTFKCRYSSPFRMKNSISTLKSKTYYKPGGIMIMTVGNFSGRVINNGVDIMGQWSY